MGNAYGPCKYYINAHDRICGVSSAWDSLAEESGAPQFGRDIIGCSLYDFIDGHESK